MKLPEPLVSVVIPAYNAERHLRETLVSILRQTFRDIEVLVVDDGSRDRTAEIVKEMAAADPRLRYEAMPTNTGGPAGPRNRGVQLARASWIAFCDSDDLWVPHKLELQYPLAQGLDACLICTRIEDFDDGTPPPAVAPPVQPPQISFIGAKQMLLKNWIAMASVLCRRDALLKAGLFEEDRGFVAVEDYDLWLRMMDLTGLPAARIDATLVLYRRVSASISASKTMMLRKALRVQSRAYERRGLKPLIYPLIPLHLAAYLGTSFWMRKIMKRL